MSDVGTKACLKSKTVMSTSRHCYAVGCSNGGYRLMKWGQKRCNKHQKLKKECGCNPPFKLFTFPTQRLNPTARQRWIKAFSRAAFENSHELFQPRPDHRVCSEHFVDGYPSLEHPDPELNLRLSDAGLHKGPRRKYLLPGTEPEFKVTAIHDQENIDNSDFEEEEMVTSVKTESFFSLSSFIGFKFIVSVMISLLQKYKFHNLSLQRENVLLKRKVALLEYRLKLKTPKPTI